MSDDVIVPLDSMAGWVQHYHDCMRRKAEAERDAEHAKDKIKQVMDATDGTLGTVDGKPMVRVSRFQRTSIDAKRLRKEKPDVAQAYTTTTDVTTMKVVDG